MRNSLRGMHHCILRWSRGVTHVTVIPRAALTGATIVSFVLGGCASPPLAGPGGDANYWHPRTGDLRHCDNHTAAGFLLFGAIGAVISGGNYADCKSDLEEKGYVRFKGSTPPVAMPTSSGPATSVESAPATDKPVVAAKPVEAAPKHIEPSQEWIIGKWQTVEGRSGGVDGVGQFQFREDRGQIRWTMARSGWVSGVQTTQKASGSVRKMTDTTVELVGTYESSNLGNVEGHPLKHSLVRDGLGLTGYETGDDARQSALALKKVP